MRSLKRIIQCITVMDGHQVDVVRQTLLLRIN